MCANSNTIAQSVDDAVRYLRINRNSFCLLLSDVAKYWVATGAILKSLYTKLFHVLCVADLWHNCAIKVKSYFEVVDQLIEIVKLATVKSKTKQAKFTAIGWLPASACCYKMAKLVRCCLIMQRIHLK